MGKTLGFVVNEQCRQGCGVIVSNSVGSGEDFKTLERFKVFTEPNASELAQAVLQLSAFPRDFNWAKQQFEKYSLHATAESMAQELQELATRTGKVIASLFVCPKKVLWFPNIALDSATFGVDRQNQSGLVSQRQVNFIILNSSF